MDGPDTFLITLVSLIAQGNKYKLTKMTISRRWVTGGKWLV